RSASNSDATRTYLARLLGVSADARRLPGPECACGRPNRIVGNAVFATLSGNIPDFCSRTRVMAAGGRERAPDRGPRRPRVRDRARAGPCRFTLLIPDEPRKGRADWTLESALPLLERAAGAPVEGLVGTGDPVEAVQAALKDPGFDEVIISTLPKRVSEWLRR